MLRGSAFIFPACVLLSVLVQGQGQTVPSAASADQDPIGFFAGLAALPEDQQDAFLMMAGQSMMQNDPAVTCNIFGGTDSCKAMPAESKFATTCKDYRPDLKVDCAYYSASEEHLESHPGDALNKVLGDSYNVVEQHCPQCFINLQALWCVQALPECGSFQKHVHKAIFPAILAAKKAEDAAQPQNIAIAEAVPGLVAAMSKTMACKEMCEAAVTSCSCKADGDGILTFGEALENAEKIEAGFKELGLQTLGDDFKDNLFQDIWNKPVCDIFTSKDDPAFDGTCDVELIGDKAKCGSTAFCDGLTDDQKSGTETIIATQLARSVFAFIEGPAGIIQQSSSTTDAAKNGHFDALPGFKKPGIGVTPPSTPVVTPPPTSSATTSAATTSVEVEVPPPAKKTGSSIGAVFGTLALLVVIGGVAVFGWKKYQEYKASRYGDYGPMGLDAYGDDGIPLQ